MPDNTFAVILAGGKGERFWPLSTSARPKQMVSLIGDKSLLALAVERLNGLVPPERAIIITSSDLVPAIRETASGLPAGNIVGEPAGRDTAAACALASAIVGARDPAACFCILTADHMIGNISGFQNTLSAGFDVAMSSDVLVTVGIRPAFPSTGFGYIQAGEPFALKGSVSFMKALRFVEKPDRPTAETYLKSGGFYWNSGMFVWSVASLRKALRKFQPRLATMAENVARAADTPRFNAVLEDEYSRLDRISIDYAVMEKADNIVVAEGTFQWDDVGSWPALENHFEPDKDANVMIGQAEQIDSKRNVVVSNTRLTALIGVEDIVVVQAENATLVCRKDRAQDVKEMVRRLSGNDRYRAVL